MGKSKLELSHTHAFKVHVPNLIKEITDSGLRQKNGVLKIPILLFRKYLESVAQRCAEINDPVLNKLMVEMALYDQADPTSKDFDQSMVDAVMENFQEYQQK